MRKKDDDQMNTISLYAKEIDGIWFGVACDEKTVYATTFAPSKEKALKGLEDSIPSRPFSENDLSISNLARRVITALADIYSGKESAIDFPLGYERLPAYTRKVIKTVSKIPVGYVTSYGLVAKAVGGAPIAVGQVMARNSFAPLCPCHRVVASDFTLHGYGAGLDVKLAFLNREKRGYQSERDIAVDGKKLHLFPVERVLCKKTQ